MRRFKNRVSFTLYRSLRIWLTIFKYIKKRREITPKRPIFAHYDFVMLIGKILEIIIFSSMKLNDTKIQEYGRNDGVHSILHCQDKFYLLEGNSLLLNRGQLKNPEIFGALYTLRIQY